MTLSTDIIPDFVPYGSSIVFEVSTKELRFTEIKTQSDWDDLYRKVYSAYEDSMVKDEQERERLGKILDSLIGYASKYVMAQIIPPIPEPDANKS
jgi:hypothetical protein